MKFVERMIHFDIRLSTEEIMEKEKKWEAIEDQLGFPKKKRYRAIYGKEASGTFVWERVWDSFAALEAAYLSAYAVPEYGTISDESPDFGPSRREMYYTLDD